MGNIVDYYRELEEAEAEYDLNEIAAALGGEVDGIWVRCPSPGEDEFDRSCFVKFYGATRFWIYDCVGKKGKAYATIKAKLGIADISPSERPDNSEAVKRILRETHVGRGSGVERYLRSREIMMTVPYCLNFHPRLFHTPSGKYFPAMVAERQNVLGQQVAIHRTWLAWDHFGKAPIPKADVRMDLGPTKGTAIRLTDVDYCDELLIGEGIETTLSGMILFGLPGWAAGSAGMLRDLELPPEIWKVLILADGDEPGVNAAFAAAARWKAEHRTVRMVRAPWGKDFNDVLIEAAKERRHDR
jgi:hypothetical protein